MFGLCHRVGWSQACWLVCSSVSSSGIREMFRVLSIWVKLNQNDKAFIPDWGHPHKNNCSRITYRINKLKKKKKIYFNQKNEGGIKLWVTRTAPENTWITDHNRLFKTYRNDSAVFVMTHHDPIYTCIYYIYIIHMYIFQLYIYKKNPIYWCGL